MMRVTIECFSRNRRLFEFGEIIAVGLDQVADALDRIGLEAGAFVAVGHLGRDHGLAAAGFGIGGVQPLQGMGHAGAQFGEIAQFLLRQVDLPEQRIGKDLVQLGEEAVLVGGGEVAQIEVIGLRQPEQDLRRHRALVALYQVDIARGNAEALGHLGLRQPQLLADAAEPGADKQLLSGIGGHGSLADGSSGSVTEPGLHLFVLTRFPARTAGHFARKRYLCDKHNKMTSMTSSDVT
jgi:hypothetical protein